MGDSDSTVAYYEESVEFLFKLPAKDLEILDVATSLAKVADVDRSLGDENAANNRFQEAIKCLESLKPNPSEAALEKRRQSVLDFLHKQLEDK